MKKWYKDQIIKMLNEINDEVYLKKIYIIIKNHLIKKGD